MTIKNTEVDGTWAKDASKHKVHQKKVLLSTCISDCRNSTGHISISLSRRLQPFSDRIFFNFAPYSHSEGM